MAEKWSDISKHQIIIIIAAHILFIPLLVSVDLTHYKYSNYFLGGSLFALFLAVLTYNTAPQTDDAHVDDAPHVRAVVMISNIGITALVYYSILNAGGWGMAIVLPAFLIFFWGVPLLINMLIYHIENLYRIQRPQRYILVRRIKSSIVNGILGVLFVIPVSVIINLFK